MSGLSPTGARILAENDNGTVTGHPAALARLEAGGLVTRAVNGVRTMTDKGHAAHTAWLTEHGRTAPGNTAAGHA
ncbi:hypothetical protein [Streptomyces sp. NPDC001889]